MVTTLRDADDAPIILDPAPLPMGIPHVPHTNEDLARISEAHTDVGQEFDDEADTGRSERAICLPHSLSLSLTLTLPLYLPLFPYTYLFAKNRENVNKNTYPPTHTQLPYHLYLCLFDLLPLDCPPVLSFHSVVVGGGGRSLIGMSVCASLLLRVESFFYHQLINFSIEIASINIKIMKQNL